MPVRRRHLRRDDDAVASTVGTLMALLVALAFLSLIVNQYVPVWQQESEAAHMNTTLGQFGAFKGAIDSQIVSARVAATSGTAYIPVETFSPFQLGVEGVPIFAAPTNGRLTGSGDGAPWTVQFRYDVGTLTNQPVTQTASGRVTLEVAARFNVPFTMTYESGAIIMSQSAGETVRVDPQFAVLNGTQGVEVGFTLVHFIGSGNAAGHGTEGIQSKLVALDMQDYTAFRSSLWVNHTTQHGHAWYAYFNQTLARAFGVLASDLNKTGYNYTEALDGSGQAVITPFYSLSRVQSGLVHQVNLEIKHNDPLGNRPIAKLSLHQAVVTIAVGTQASALEV